MPFTTACLLSHLKWIITCAKFGQKRLMVPEKKMWKKQKKYNNASK